jgi:hypothetical protein
MCFGCPLAKYAWLVVKSTFSISHSPHNIDDMMDGWIQSFHDNKQKNLVLLGCGALVLVYQEMQK